MANETWSQNQRAVAALNIKDGDHLLDIGCGPGRVLSELAERTPKGHAVGVDPSELMVEIATQRNRPLIMAKRVNVLIAEAASLPFPDNTFDKALCVHVIYFWSDFRTNFREIGRVLKPGGRLALLFRSTLHQTAVKSFPADVYRFPEVAEVRVALLTEGFEVEPKQALTAVDGRSVPAPHLLIATRTAR